MRSMTTRPTTPSALDAFDAFEAFEASGWERKAAGYQAFFTQITNRTIDDLLDAARVGPGTRLLDVATGPGLVAGRAVERGATALGIDIAEAMLAMARQHWPSIEFRQADAHELPFTDACFDAVTGNFALLHLGRPERAAAEFTRVLAPGGRLALTVWDEPERAALFGAVLEALDACGATPPDHLPAGPPFFRFSADAELRALLEERGLDHVAVTTLRFTHLAHSVDEVWNGILDGTVRTSALISGQPAATRRRIRHAFGAILDRYRQDDVLALPVSVKLAAGTVTSAGRADSAATR
jgi:ubiquinone/menaquinone biosynthesis C-methylase UbiE